MTCSHKGNLALLLGMWAGRLFHTPIGEVPVLLLIILAAMVTYLRARKLKAAYFAPTAEVTQSKEA